MIKKIFTILFSLYAWIIPAQLSAQIYSTAEASLSANRHRSTPVFIQEPTITSFRSTSIYATTSANSSTFSVATMQMANSNIRTAASTLTGGILADDAGFISTENNTTTSNWNDEEDGIGPGTPDLPLHLDWDALLFVLLLAILYLIRKSKIGSIQA
ncbi:MAG: hypothetical protein IKY87_01530 [Paludibacteraceae bacterium]|nr:hypothetical protein [Paludibacteraceae bacterium]